jgi:hypothetical protein
MATVSFQEKSEEEQEPRTSRIARMKEKAEGPFRPGSASVVSLSSVVPVLIFMEKSLSRGPDSVSHIGVDFLD